MSKFVNYRLPEGACLQPIHLRPRVTILAVDGPLFNTSIRYLSYRLPLVLRYADLDVYDRYGTVDVRLAGYTSRSLRVLSFPFNPRMVLGFNPECSR